MCPWYPPVGLGYTPVGLGYPPVGLEYPPVGLGYPPVGLGYPPVGLGYPPIGLGISTCRTRNNFNVEDTSHRSSDIRAENFRMVDIGIKA